MVSLGALTLHKGLVWKDEFGNPSIAMNTRRTLGGTLSVQTASITKGREIVLSTEDRQGVKSYFTRTEIQSIKQLETNGSIIAFVHPNESIASVMVVPGGINVEPLGAKLSPTGEDIYVGSVKILEV